MTTALPESTYAVLGLVDKLPRSSGYDLVGVAGRSFAHFWPISQTLLYRELNRLADLGWVHATRVEQERSPSKWIYETTRPGREALTDWLADPAAAKGTVRSGFLLHFFFAERMRPEQVRSLLDDYRVVLTAQIDEFSELVEKLATMSTPGARTGRLSALHGLRTAQARLQWIVDVETELTL